MAKIIAHCINCKNDFLLTVDAGRYTRWVHGEGLIQNMLPELDADERELLMSKVCGKCFDAMFTEEDDDAGG